MQVIKEKKKEMNSLDYIPRDSLLTTLTKFQDPKKYKKISSPQKIFGKDHKKIIERKFGLWGFANLLNIILILFPLREIVRNYFKYGILYEFYLKFYNNVINLNWDSLEIIILLLMFGVWIFISFCLEKMIGSKIFYRKLLKMEKKEEKKEKNDNIIQTIIFNEKTLFILQFINVSSFLSVMLYFSIATEIWPFYTFLFCISYLIVFFKLISYYHINYLYRNKIYKSTIYPKNIKFCELVYFIFAPALVYIDQFPRTKRINKRRLLFLFLELFVTFSLFLILCSQYLIPLVANSVQPFEKLNWPQILQRFLKLLFPAIFIWLVCFFLFFHVVLNIFAEVLCFSDRFFYSNWWDSTSFADFWNKWNIPVHKYCKIHIYIPILRNGGSKPFARFVVFLVSAIFHELVLAVSFKSLKFIGFIVMILSIPAIIISQPLKGKKAGNYFFWIVWMSGFSTVILWYYMSWVSSHPVINT